MNIEPATVSIADAAAECGESVAHYLGKLVYVGLLFEVPGGTDPRCTQVFPGAFRWHADDCECRFVAGPHPSLVALDETHPPGGCGPHFM